MRDMPQLNKQERRAGVRRKNAKQRRCKEMRNGERRGSMSRWSRKRGRRQGDAAEKNAVLAVCVCDLDVTLENSR